MKVAVFICAMMFAGAVAAQDCSLKQIASLPITTTSTGKIAVPIRIDGTDRLFAVMLDSAISGVSANFVSEQNLDTNPVSAGNVPVGIYDIGASPYNAGFLFQDPEFTEGLPTSVTHTAILPDVGIGAIEIKNLKVSELSGWKSPDGVVGVLGTGLLRHFDVDLVESRSGLFAKRCAQQTAKSRDCLANSRTCLQWA